MNYKNEAFQKAPGTELTPNVFDSVGELWTGATSLQSASAIPLFSAHVQPSVPLFPMYIPQNAPVFPQYDGFIRYLQNLSVESNRIEQCNGLVQMGYQTNQSSVALNGGAVVKSSVDKPMAETTDISSICCTAAHFDQLTELTHIALKGCDLAEQLANSHKKRPCFKKIDSLAARLKQDLMRSDNVLANINSQGVAWAVKDFIFVFTRIINAWLIIKGYVYNTPDGLGSVRAALSSDFHENFEQWQAATLGFVNSLIKSFMSLDQLVQNQRVSTGAMSFQNFYQANKKSPLSDSSASSSSTQSSPYKPKDLDYNNEVLFTDSFESLKDCFAEEVAGSILHTANVASQLKQPDYDSDNVSIARNSEETQLKMGGYLKTGIYNPLKVRVMTATQESTTACKMSSTEKSTSKIVNTSTNTDHEQVVDLFNLSENCKAAVERKKLNKRVVPSPSAFSEPAMVKKCEYLMQRVCELPEAQYFFSLQFAKNYFPDFELCNPKFIDIRSIILKTQTGDYGSIDEIIMDLFQIVNCGKRYLIDRPYDLMAKSVAAFETNLNEILDEPFFANCGYKTNV